MIRWLRDLFLPRRWFHMATRDGNWASIDMDSVTGFKFSMDEDGTFELTVVTGTTHIVVDQVETMDLAKFVRLLGIDDAIIRASESRG